MDLYVKFQRLKHNFKKVQGFLQNYQGRRIFRINELFFYCNISGIGPRSIDRVNGGQSTSPRTLIKSELSVLRSSAMI
jgi:hypothetical protein